MMNNIKKDTIFIEGMSCGHCKNAVEEAVKSLTGVMLAEVDLEAKTLMVEFDSNNTTLEKIKEAVDEEGYTVVEGIV